MCLKPAILPPEIITEILSYLPVKPLTRFKTVSKPWLTLISSPVFIKLHLSKTLVSQTLNPNFIFSSFSLAISPFNDSILRFTELDHPLKNPNYPECITVKILGSCNGIICYGPFGKGYACFYNPCTGSNRILPRAPARFPDRKVSFLDYGPKTEEHVSVYGFGYDAHSGDYKLLKMSEYFKNSVFVGRESCVYSFLNDSWKFIKDSADDDDNNNNMSCGLLGNECAYLDGGLLYFIVDNKFKDKGYVKCFNLRTEEFSVMELPRYAGEKCDMFCCEVRQVSGRLCMMVHGQNRVSGSRGGRELVLVEMWVVMNECWVRLFCITEKGKFGKALSIKPLVFGKEGQTVFVELDGESFGWFDWEKDCFDRVLANGDMPYGDAPFDTWTYVETLVSVGKGDGNSKGKSVSKKKKSDVDGFLSSGFNLRL